MSAIDDRVIASEGLADMQVIADSIVSGRPLDPKLVERVLEESRKAQDELLRRFGVREIAVDLIRAARDDR